MFIPGFRTKKVWKIIIAIIYYLICIGMLSEGIGYSLGLLSLPFVVFGALDLFKHRKKAVTAQFILSILIFVIAIIITPSPDTDTPESTITVSPEPTNTTAPIKDQMQVHFLDVGQADSILITTSDGKAMLVDAGNNADSDLVVNYIKNQGIEKLDFIVGTHPHEDHIGGLDAVINTFDIGTILMPKVSSNTKTFEDVLLAIQNKGMNVTAPEVGIIYQLGKATFTILAPVSSEYADINNFSIVIRLSYGDSSFLLMGDAENVSELEIMDTGMNIVSDVIKIGHHGSSSSSSLEFLENVKPKYSVISVGANNSYGHPDSTVLERVDKLKIETLRTDKHGTIIFTTDVKNLSYTTEVFVSPNPTPFSQHTSVKTAGVVIESIYLPVDPVTITITSRIGDGNTKWATKNIWNNR